MVAGGVECAIAMEVKTRQVDSAKGERHTPSTPLRHRPNAGKLLELTPLWEAVVKYNRLPQNIDKINVFTELGVRLNEPEWEVRQHALRVLTDLIPVVSKSLSSEDLDALIVPAVLGDVTHNLGHPAPAVRNSALDVLLAYLKFTSDPEFVLRSIVSAGLESPAASGNLSTTVVQILPRLLDQTVSISHQSLVHLVTAVSKKLSQMPYQRHAMETMNRIKDHVGDSRFDHFLESYYPQVKRDLDMLCQVYQVETNLRDSGIDLQSPPHTAQDTWSDSSLSPTQPKLEDVKLEEYDGAESDQESEEEKVPPDDDSIMAKNSALLTALTEGERSRQREEDDLDDEEEDDTSRKSPRRVRFGGEVVKLRTPDSDVTNDGVGSKSEPVSLESLESEKNDTDMNPSFEVIPPQQKKRLRSSHIPVPINPVLNRPRQRHKDPFIPTYDGGESVTTSSSDGEQFKTKEFYLFQQQAEMMNLNFLPSDLIQLLAKKDDWRTRVRGLDRLASWVTNGRLSEDQAGHLLLHLIGCLSEEPRQARLLASLLRATKAVISQDPNNLELVLPMLIPSVCRNLACGSPLPARLEAVEAIKTLMRVSTPATVINVVFSDRCIHSRSSKLRENSLLSLMYALMTFPSNEFDCELLAGQIKEMAVNEPKRRVRQAVLETLAILAQFVSRSVFSIKPDEYENSEDAVFFTDAVQARLARRQLPAVSHEGLIFYALQIPPMTGTDVDWILAGVGSLSSGSARSRSQMDYSNSSLSQSSESMFSAWSKEPSNQKMMAIGVAMPQKNHDTFFNSNHDEKFYNTTWSSDPRLTHPSNSQAFPLLNTSYNGRFVPKNNMSNGKVDFSQTWSGSRWTQQSELPPHVSIKQSSYNHNSYTGLPPINITHVADWRNRKDNSEQVITGYRSFHQDEHRKGRWEKRHENVSFRRPITNSYHDKENGFVRSSIEASEASRSDPSLAAHSPHSSPAHNSASSNISNSKIVENGLAASSPSLGQVDIYDEIAGRPSRLSTPVSQSVNSSLFSVTSQPHSENGFIEQGKEEERTSRSSGREDIDYAQSRAETPAPATPGPGTPRSLPPESNCGTPAHCSQNSPLEQDECQENCTSQPTTPNVQSVGTPCSEISGSSRNTEVTSKSLESLKFGEEIVKNRMRIPRAIDLKRRSRAIGQEVMNLDTVCSLYPSSLTPFENPRDAVTKAVLQLENPEWEVIIQGLQTVVRLVRHHTKEVQGNVLHSFVVLLAKHIKNLRSQVARGACQCAGELFRTLGKHMDNADEDLAGPLLSRTADTNKFLRGDSCSALDAMVDHTSPSKSVASLISKGSKHQNAVVRAATSRLLFRLCQRLGPEKTLALPKDTRDAIVLAGAKFLTEGSLETRKYAKEMFAALSTSHRFNGILVDVIPHNIMRNIQKILSRITA